MQKRIYFTILIYRFVSGRRRKPRARQAVQVGRESARLANMREGGDAGVV
jgi:hypothetical protein